MYKRQGQMRVRRSLRAAQAVWTVRLGWQEPGNERHGAFYAASFCLRWETAGAGGRARLLLKQGQDPPVLERVEYSQAPQPRCLTMAGPVSYTHLDVYKRQVVEPETT